MNVYDSRRRLVSLGNRIGHGGEASVYRVEGRSASLAKIYEPAPKPQYLTKLEWMQAHPPENPTQSLHHSSLAWPSELLYDPQRRLAGYIMPFIRGAVPVLEVFNPRRRLETLPKFDRRYLHRVARNLSAAIGAVHSVGYVIGDINESNILVTPSALVTVIDTDSFQVEEVRHGRRVMHSCPVGKPEYTPPELQGQSLVKIERLPEHDAFGLAVLIFQLLMEGSHPFRAQWLGKGDPPPLETRIIRGYFPYTTAPGALVAPPANALSLNLLHPWLSELFRRCFVDGYRKASIRPEPSQWEHAIAEAESCLVTCEKGHIFSNHLRDCPACHPGAVSQAKPTIPSRSTNAGRTGYGRNKTQPAPQGGKANSPNPPSRPSGFSLFPFGWLFSPPRQGSVRANPQTQPPGPASTKPATGAGMGAGTGKNPVSSSSTKPRMSGSPTPAGSSTFSTTKPPTAPGKPSPAASTPFRASYSRSSRPAPTPPPSSAGASAGAAAPSTPFPWTWPRTGFPSRFPSRPIYNPPPNFWEWLRAKTWKSLIYGGGYGALIGILPGVITGLATFSFGSLPSWNLLWALGGASGGLLRGYQPSYRFGSWVNRHIGWRRFWKGAGIGLGVSLGFLTMLPFIWMIVPPILMMVLGGMLGSSAGEKIWLLGARAGWERIWAVTGTAGTALVGFIAAWLFSHTGIGIMTFDLANQLMGWLQAQSAGWNLIWAIVGGLAGSFGGALAGFLADLFARLFGLVD